ncbi:MAG: DUF547 domain-containing protein [Saprospiraceae bacterium]
MNFKCSPVLFLILSALCVDFVAAQPSHDLWAKQLAEFVDSEGRVDYDGWSVKASKLNAYLKTLGEQPPGKEWSAHEQMAYWINAYNAFTVKMVIDHLPIKSLRDIHDGNPWVVSWIRIGEEVLSLDDIEHQRLRAQFQEPAIHFALNCASVSCPPLSQQAYHAHNLPEMLQERTRAFINHPNYNLIEKNQIQLSKIFDWYADDFGDVRAYINQYCEPPLRADIPLEYLEYDWSLNRQ